MTAAIAPAAPGLLYATLHRWAATPHVWGYADCMMVLADWVQAVQGWDPAQALRGTYGDPEVCPLGRAYRRDPEPVLRDAFARLPLVEAPSPGDVALVSIAGDRWQSGALRLKTDHWALLTRGHGVLTVPGRAVRAALIWGVGYAE